MHHVCSTKDFCLVIVLPRPYAVSGIPTDEPALFANSWAVDLPRERSCPSVDLDFSGPCESDSDMDVRITAAVSMKTQNPSFYLRCK